MLTRHLAVIALIASIAATAPGVQASAPTAVDDSAILHVLNRLTYGPRPGDVARVKAMGLQNWLDSQLTPARIDDRVLQAKLATLDTLMLDAQTIQRDYAGPAMAERRRRKLAAANTGAAEDTDGTDQGAARRMQ